jgi:hypothetical protein
MLRWMWDEAVWVVAERSHLRQCSHLYMGSLSRNNIGDETAWYLGAALQVNKTLTTLE